MFNASHRALPGFEPISLGAPGFGRLHGREASLCSLDETLRCAGPGEKRPSRSAGPSSPRPVRPTLALFCIVVAGFLASCTKQEGAPGAATGSGAVPPAAGKTLRIAVIPKGTTHGFWQSVHAGAIKAERELNAAGVKVAVEWKGPPKEDDREQQIQVVENFVSARVSGIVLAPLDDQALLRPVEQAAGEGIPVVIFDSGLKGQQGKDFVSYVATDNRAGGVLAAKRLGQVMGGKGKAILLRYQVGSASTTLREEGFLETLKADFPAIELLSSDQYAGATMEAAQEKAQNLLIRFKDQVEGLFTPNESSTFGTLRALQEAGLAGKVKFVGFDSSKDLMTAMEKGEIHGLVLQRPIEMGYLAVKTMVEHLQGKTVVPVVDTGALMVTPENREQPEMKLLHSPDLSPWLGK